jgi:hypothetical protein
VVVVLAATFLLAATSGRDHGRGPGVLDQRETLRRLRLAGTAADRAGPGPAGRDDPPAARQTAA